MNNGDDILRKKPQFSWADLLQPKPPEPPKYGNLFEYVASRPNPPTPASALMSSLLGQLPKPTPQPTLLSGLFIPQLNPATLLAGFGAPFTPQIPKHKVFVSFHHDNDEAYKQYFVKHFDGVMDGFVSQAVGDGDINPWLPTDTIRNKIRDEFIRDATVAVVLIGTQTWQRRHVDWEISSSIRETKLHKRCGLIGILLPTHPSYKKPQYDSGIVPPRLYDNQVCGYADIYHWTEDATLLRGWIHDAYERRTQKQPDNSYESFVNNKTAARWR
jgi:hypothetical protein